MNSEQLIKFAAIAEHNSMREAADSLFITQPALSRALADLEEELNCKLFLRDKKRLTLTENGICLLKYAKNIIELINQAKTELNATDKTSIAAQSIYPAYLLSNYPADKISSVSIKQIDYSKMPTALLCGEIDLAVCDDFYMKHYDIPNLKKFLISTEHLAVFVPKGHPLYEKKELYYADIKGVPLCMRSDFRSLREWLDIVEQISGMSFSVNFYMDRLTFINLKDSLPYPEIRGMQSLTNPKQEINKSFKMIPLKGTYCKRNIYIWYVEANRNKAIPFIENIKQYYLTPPQQNEKHSLNLSGFV